MTKLIIALVMTMSAVSAFADDTCSRKVLRPEILKQLNYMFDNTVIEDSLKITPVIIEQVLPDGVSPIAVYFEIKDFDNDPRVRPFIAQFALNYKTCVPDYRYAAHVDGGLEH